MTNFAPVFARHSEAASTKLRGIFHSAGGRLSLIQKVDFGKSVGIWALSWKGTLFFFSVMSEWKH